MYIYKSYIPQRWVSVPFKYVTKLRAIHDNVQVIPRFQWLFAIRDVVTVFAKDLNQTFTNTVRALKCTVMELKLRWNFICTLYTDSNDFLN